MAPPAADGSGEEADHPHNPPGDQEEDEWSREADSLLEAPELRTESRTINGDVATKGALVKQRRSLLNDRGRHDPATDHLQVLVATLIEMLSQLCTGDSSDAVFLSLSRLLINTGSVSALHFSEDYKPFRMAISDALRVVIANQAEMYSNVFVDRKLTMSPNATSRYRRDYKELEEIGCGGFGRVFKVKSNLDQQIYAVKKIKVKKTGAEAALNEVRILASLNHQSVVRYHVSWFELDEKEFVETVVDSPYESQVDIREVDGSDNDRTLSDSQMSWASSEAEPAKVTMGKFYRGNDESSDSESSESGSEPDTSDVNEDSVSELDDSHEIEFAKSEELAVVPKTASPLMPLDSYTVYIVMELCKWTLEDYLRKRNSEPSPVVNVVDAYTIFEDLLSALAYLHESGVGVIHRDIKPSNVFLKMTSTGVRALLGDFGLACNHRRSSLPAGSGDWSVSTFSAETNHTKTEGVGTRWYAAPEQLVSTDYDCTVDVYSLGLVMYEFFHTVNTGMERAKLMENLRTTGKTSEEFRLRYKMIANVIEDMVCQDARKRPSARNILDNMLLHSPTTVEKLRRSLKVKDAEIHRLRSLLRQFKENCSCGGSFESMG